MDIAVTGGGLDPSAYREAFMESIRESMESMDFDSACVQLATFLVGMYAYYQNNEINTRGYREALRSYRRLTLEALNGYYGQFDNR